MMKLLWLNAVVMGSVLMLGCQNLQPDATTNTRYQDKNLKAESDTSYMMNHLTAFQNIAAQNNGNRAVGTSGGQASAKYIIDQVKKLGLNAQAIPFENRDKVVGQNIIVEISGQSKDSAIILGGHYDSVKTGPGINDNASGVAVLLELIKHYQQQNIKPKHTLYFAFWDSEEEGIGGSQAFVKSLTPEKLKQIKAYINLDMVGTKDPEIMIADGDESSIDDMEKLLKERGMSEADYKPITDPMRQVPHHTGDLVLESHLKEFFKLKGLKVKEDASTLTASDTLAFMGKVPVTSVIMFNEQVKDGQLEFAPCYHKACDQIDLIDEKSMLLSKEAVLFLLNKL